MPSREWRGEGASRRQRLTFFALLLLVAALPVGAFLWATDTPGSSYQDHLAEPVDNELADRLRTHVEILAASPRNLQKPTSIVAASTYIEGQLALLGYEVERQPVLDPANNLIVTLAATTRDAPVLIIGAHYDSFGNAPGADDNASGTAALLELARLLRNFRGRMEIRLVFWANEEPPYFKTTAMGSLVHAQSLEDDRHVVGAISLETMGYFDDRKGSQQYPFPLSVRYPDTGNFIAFVGDLSARSFLRESIGAFREHARIPSVGGTAPSFVQGIDWSDHWAYSREGIPAFMVTDTALFRNPNYHQTTDTPETLDYRRLALVVEALASLTGDIRG